MNKLIHPLGYPEDLAFGAPLPGDLEDAYQTTLKRIRAAHVPMPRTTHDLERNADDPDTPTLSRRSWYQLNIASVHEGWADRYRRRYNT